MPIDTQLEDERGNIIAKLDSPSWLMNWLLSCSDLDNTVCLRFIDHYGNTVFNCMQMEELAKELSITKNLLTEDDIERHYNQWLSNMKKRGPDIHEVALRYPKPTKDALLAHADSLLKLLDSVKSSHHYLRFIGD